VKAWSALLAGLALGSSLKAPAPSDTPAFAVGEKLVFKVEWSPPWYLFFLPPMEAGEAELSLEGETLFEAKKALKISFKARSSGALVRLAGVTVDDAFEFLTDPETFCTFSVAKKVREGKRKRDLTVVYLPQAGALHIRELDVAATPAQVKRDETVKDVPPCVKDLFSALYSVRRREFSGGSVHRDVVGDNARVKEVEVRVLKAEKVDTPHGKFDTWKLETVALLGGLFREGGGHFHFWLTKDHRRLPVQFEAKVNLGKVTGKLKSVTP